MKNRSVLAACAALVSAVLVTPAASADPPAACPSPEAAVQSEVEQLRVGMRMSETFAIIGSRGTREPEADTADYIVRQWTFCADGYVTRQAVMFAPARIGWRVYEIG